MKSKPTIVKSARVRKTAPTIAEPSDNQSMGTDSQMPESKKSRRLPRPLALLQISRILPLGLVKKILGFVVPSYFINAWREVKQVSWPNRRETRRLTIAVFTFAIIFGAMVAVVDKGLDVFFKQVVLR